MKRFAIILWVWSIGMIHASAQSFNTDELLEVGDEVVVDVWYDLSKCSVRPESTLLLEQLAGHMKAKGLMIEIQHHTDLRGSAASNLKISQCRASSVSDHLIALGVPDFNVLPAGYGESQPIVKEESLCGVVGKTEQERLHQRNRRTVLRVIGKWNEVREEGTLVGRELKIDVIYDLGKRYVRSESLVMLAHIARLIEAEKLMVEIQNHLDSRGSVACCSKPSENRAKEVRKQLVHFGVLPEMVMARGYGESQLIFSDADIAELASAELKEKAHQRNRRTVLKVIAFR